MDEHESYLAPCPNCGEILDLTMKEYYARKEKYICKHCNTILIGENCGSKEVNFSCLEYKNIFYKFNTIILPSMYK